MIAKRPESDLVEPAIQTPGGRLLVDATGALLNLGGAPTGIPRVEEFLVRAALSDPDERVGAVTFNRRQRRFRFLEEPERKQLLRTRAGPPADPDRPWRGVVMHALQSVRDYPSAGREADRYLADMVTNGRRRGVDFQTAKALLRAYRAYRRVRSPGSAGSPEVSPPEPQLGASDTILLSNTTVLGSFLTEALAGPAGSAAICHDLIPMQHPDFAVSADHTRRFSEGLDRLLQANATILCAAQWTADGLSAYLEAQGMTPANIGRFPMPSILHEAEASREKQFSGQAEPFILYCSTVEVRKNHLLLAKAWKRALQENIQLPKLVCVGKWGWGTGELDSYLKENPELAESIVFTGPISDAELAAKYGQALFGVFPSRAEGWGYGASECLDFGLPVVVSTAPALIEATGGMMPAIDPDDENGWFEMIVRLSIDAPLRDRLRQAIQTGHQPVSTSASWSAIKRNFFADGGKASDAGVGRSAQA